MKMDTAKLVLILSIIFHSAAFLSGVISLFLPYWVVAESNEGPLEVNVIKKTYGGLWIKRDTIELQRINTSQSQPEDSWTSIGGSPLDTDDVTAVKGTLIPGLFFLFVSLFSLFSVCCCSKKKYFSRLTKILCGTIISTFISVVLITTGPILYATKIIKDYDFHKEQLYVGFWFAVTSAIAAGVSCFLTVASYFCYRRKKNNHFSRKSTRGETHSDPDTRF